MALASRRHRLHISRFLSRRVESAHRGSGLRCGNSTVPPVEQRLMPLPTGFSARRSYRAHGRIGHLRRQGLLTCFWPIDPTGAAAGPVTHKDKGRPRRSRIDSEDSVRSQSGPSQSEISNRLRIVNKPPILNRERTFRNHISHSWYSAPDIWNRLGTKIFPRLRSRHDLIVGIDFLTSADSGPPMMNGKISVLFNVFQILKRTSATAYGASVDASR